MGNSANVTVRVPSGMRLLWEAAARAEGLSLSQYVRRCVNSFQDRVALRDIEPVKIGRPSLSEGDADESEGEDGVQGR